MSIRSKLLIILLALGVAPMLAVSFANYVSGASTIERMLRSELEQTATRAAHETERLVGARERELLELAASARLHDYVRRAGLAVQTGKQSPSTFPSMELNASSQQLPPLPDEIARDFQSFFNSYHTYCSALTCLGAGGRPLFRVEGVSAGDGKVVAHLQTTDFVTSSIRGDERIWTTSEARALRSPISREPAGALMRSTLPILFDDATRGALVLELKVDAILREAEATSITSVEDEAGGAGGAPGAGREQSPRRLFIALDQTGNIVHHTNDALKHQTVSSAMPFFQTVAARMQAGSSGAEFFEDRAADGDRWLAAFRPVREMNLSVAVAGNYTEAASGLKRAGMSGAALALLSALVATGLLIFLVGRTSRRIERVARGAAAVAAGQLNEHIEVEGHDETRVLAESFNRMTDRLREQIQREAETKQFQSFMRLSAMLTHDLKNSIQSLSMLVGNMEKFMHREEFRADAIDSLRAATDKLRRMAARLSEPVKSLSGEYRRDARETDLVPIFRRVLAATAEQSHLFRIEAQLPESLSAFVEPERIENVFENLVINALEAMGTAGGRLSVEAGDEPGVTDRIFFSVADTGVGMTEEFIRERLFRPFATTKTKGIGLGLFTCREIVETHGGRLEVESRLGVGTRFRVVLPSKPLTLRERLEQSQGRSMTSGEQASAPSS